MWSPRQVTHLPPVWDILLPLQIEGTNGFYCLIRNTERFTISNVESQVFTPNNSRLDSGSNPGCPRDKSYHWTNCTIRCRPVVMSKNRPDVSKMTNGFFITINGDTGSCFNSTRGNVEEQTRCE